MGIHPATLRRRDYKVIAVDVLLVNGLFHCVRNPAAL